MPDPPGAGVSADIAAHAVGVIGSQRLAALVAVGYGPRSLVDPVAGALGAAARMAGIDVLDVLRVEDGRYWSYLCADEALLPGCGQCRSIRPRIPPRPPWPAPGTACWPTGPR